MMLLLRQTVPKIRGPTESVLASTIGPDHEKEGLQLMQMSAPRYDANGLVSSPTSR